MCAGCPLTWVCAGGLRGYAVSTRGTQVPELLDRPRVRHRRLHRRAEGAAADIPSGHHALRLEAARGLHLEAEGWLLELKVNILFGYDNVNVIWSSRG